MQKQLVEIPLSDSPEWGGYNVFTWVKCLGREFGPAASTFDTFAEARAEAERIVARGEASRVEISRAGKQRLSAWKEID